ncbi:MAG: hypothetical protein QW677_07680 [Pyrobaculum sp.]|uniref:Uncharacterized protein n=2 Tax=Pyrobaculum arsenaticum TaxID=121277 RepID=A4WKQ5_PYRAR|nr:hypothetical protein [Pyrobaculum arsenaticum]ABP50972.1 hypothetical protein Pars_1412 [Pyrobaculum arsenaticum DSM 13514]MCY0890725.1 hypothetical protein [Pyrobaculum arsenaticum]NYR15305.1 hypothetical protein [Pyrobaculum arsenaticum]
MFYVYVNNKEGRVLLTTRRIRHSQWKLAGAYSQLKAATRQARFIADAREYILEWDAPLPKHTYVTQRGGDAAT